MLLGFVGVLFSLPGWTITPVDKGADVSMLDAGSGVGVASGGISSSEPAIGSDF